VIAGLANEYADYFTTPQEYDAQHYEGAATVYGRASSDALEQTLVDLTKRLVGGRPAPKPYAYDPRNGVTANARPFPSGPSAAQIVAQPSASSTRLAHPVFSWHGGPRGYDRPLDRAFVLIKRRTQGRWKTIDSDLGIDVLWTVDDNGLYRAEWEPPLDARLGRLRFTIHANHYRLRSRPFRLSPAHTLTAKRVTAASGRAAIVLDYPKASVHEAVGDPAPDSSADLTYRPVRARSGVATFVVDGRRVTAKAGPGGRFSVAAPAGAEVEVRPGSARDRFGNRNGNDLAFSA
jgi:neutral ceramidase